MALLVCVMVGAFVLLLSALFRVAAALRLTLPLLYGLLAPTLFSEWFYANYALANFIGYALLGLTGLSWLVSLIRKIRQFRADRIEEKFSMELLRHRLREPAEYDENGYRIVNVDGLFR